MDSTNRIIRPKKSLGQNYLTDDNICRNIVDSFNIKEDDLIVEIGPGTGAITKFILEKTKNLLAVEIDTNNITLLKEKFPEINLLNKDFLKVGLKELSSETGNKKLRIIGNIPYNITTEIVFKLIDSREFISDAQLMVQEEVAERFAARPDTKEYGIPSVFVQVFSRPELLFKVNKNCFYPKPKIDSRIIHFDYSINKTEKIKDITFFKIFVKTAFNTRRKTLRNSLKKLELDLSKSDFDFQRRAGTLSVDEFIDLSNELYMPLIDKEK